MKVLFVSSGNNKNGISPIIKNQGESLVKYADSEIDYYTIEGKGIRGYLSNIKPLRRYYKKGGYDIVHAHYSLSAFVASLAGCKPLVVSLMGSDIKSNNTYKWLIRFFAFAFSWKEIIVKSDDMRESIGMKNIQVIPNGVDLERFHSMDKKECQLKLGWNTNHHHVLFAANPERPEKNYTLAEAAMKSINDNAIELHSLDNVPNEEMPVWFNAADVVLLTSLWEGSPNVIKEAMACNRPIVCTDVGDVKWLLNGCNGCFICSFNSAELVGKLRLALRLDAKGRERIVQLGLSNEMVAEKIIDIYQRASKL